MDLISLARKSFRQQNSDDETVLADEKDYVRDLNDLIHYLIRYQLRYQIKQSPQFPSKEIMLG